MRTLFLWLFSMSLLTALAAPASKPAWQTDIDYSYCGYHASADSLPLAPVRAYVAWADGDMSPVIQQAIDYVSALPADAHGMRGAVLLGPGTFHLDQRLAIEASGVVLRGSGRDATTLVKYGVERGSLLRIEGRRADSYSADTLWATAFVPVGTMQLEVRGDLTLHPGQQVEVTRHGTRSWIESLGCQGFGGGLDALGWKVGDMDLRWRRQVTDVRRLAPGRWVLTLDAPLTMGFDPQQQGRWTDNKGKTHDEAFSPCYVRTLEQPGVVSESGVEAMTLMSDYDTARPHDENHCWTGVSIEYAHDCWVRQVDFRQLAGSAVIMQPTAQRITVEDCRSTEHVSENAGLRRTSFYVLGQQCLVQRCYSHQGRHAFVTGFCAAGPNAFVQCEAAEALSYSGSMDSWACGTLFDIVDVDGHDLLMKNLGQDNNGAGWTAANSMAWQCTAAEVHCYSPDTLNRNYAHGTWAQFSGNGVWSGSNGHVHPRSLFYAQLSARLGLDIDYVAARHPLFRQARIINRSTDASSSPTVEKAQQMAYIARTEPRQTLDAWIQDAALPATAFAVPTAKGKKKGSATVKDFTPQNSLLTAHKPSLMPVPATFDIQNGHLTFGGEAVMGGRYQTPWWNGRLKPAFIEGRGAQPALTRFVPDREGTGFTDRIDSVVAFMERNDIVAWDQNYGLWYDRRRDDHQRVRRRDAAVWAPFWEQPWGRTGQGHSWNGLSLYDLTTPNTWYYDRLHQFAQRIAPQGRMLYLEHYFQHNILEAGAHWVDAPWRPTNNVNHTVFPEPVPFTGDKRVFVAEWFYDEQEPTMRQLHRQYIRRNLEMFRDLPNVVHYVSEEYTGPLHFTRFWVETIRDWEQETGQHVMVALACTKDVQDSILADPTLAPTIDIIDIRYWHYKSAPDPGQRKTWDDGLDIYNPQGGVNMAPRQHMRQIPVGKVQFPEVYRTVSEYTRQHPDKAVVYYGQNYPEQALAVLMAGGSCAALRHAPQALRQQLCLMRPVFGAAAPGPHAKGAVALAGPEGGLVYGITEGDATLTLPAGDYTAQPLRSRDLQPTGTARTLHADGADGLTVHVGRGELLWLQRRP